jgi:hypothetical protein
MKFRIVLCRIMRAAPCSMRFNDRSAARMASAVSLRPAATRAYLRGDPFLFPGRMSRASAQWSCVRIVEDGEVSRWQTPFAALPSMRSLAVRRVLRQAWELDDDDKAEKLIRNLAQRLERDWSGVSGSILEGIEEILTVTRLGLPEGVAALTRLHRHYRECDGHGAARLPEREAMAFGFHGLAPGTAGAM